MVSEVRWWAQRSRRSERHNSASRRGVCLREQHRSRESAPREVRRLDQGLGQVYGGEQRGLAGLSDLAHVQASGGRDEHVSQALLQRSGLQARVHPDLFGEAKAIQRDRPRREGAQSQEALLRVDHQAGVSRASQKRKRGRKEQTEIVRFEINPGFQVNNIKDILKLCNFFFLFMNKNYFFYMQKRQRARRCL